MSTLPRMIYSVFSSRKATLRDQLKVPAAGSVTTALWAVNAALKNAIAFFLQGITQSMLCNML